jgi:hypothetical protein
MEAAMLDVKDRPGVISSKVLRVYFERAVRDTEAFATHFPLDSVTRDGSTEYVTPATQSMWLGFAIGMRCAERIAAATEAAVEVSAGIEVGRNAFRMGLPRESLPDEANRIGWDETRHAGEQQQVELAHGIGVALPAEAQQSSQQQEASNGQTSGVVSGINGVVCDGAGERRISDLPTGGGAVQDGRGSASSSAQARIAASGVDSPGGAQR